jgi:hypothetical protein
MFVSHPEIASLAEIEIGTFYAVESAGLDRLFFAFIAEVTPRERFLLNGIFV